MAGGTYDIILTDDKGLHLESLNNALWWQAARNLNRIGHLQMGLPATFDDTLLRVDRMVQIWRQPPGGRLALWRVYFIRGWRLEHGGSRELLTLWGPDTNDLLRRRIVAHYAGSSESEYTATEADNLMKDLVSYAVADGTNPAPSAGSRVWTNFDEAADLTDGPQLDKACAWRPLLTNSGGGVLSALHEESVVAGTEVFFDVVVSSVSPSSIAFEFRTYTGQPGRDMTDRVVFDQEDRNLQDPFIQYDYTEEINYVYGGGQGEEAEREIQQVYDAARYNASRWNRCEGFADARDQKTDNGVREAARALLEASRPRITAGGIPVDTAGTRFGRDWDIGDRVRMRYRRRAFDCLVRSVVLRMNDAGHERVEARLEYEG